MNKATMPEPVAYKSKDQPYLFSLSAPTGGGERWEGLTTTEQAEAYANYRVRQALEEAAKVCWLLRCSDEFEPEIQDRLLKQAEDRIRALIPKEDE